MSRKANEKKKESLSDQKSEAKTLTEVPVLKANAASCFPMFIIMCLII